MRWFWNQHEDDNRKTSDELTETEAYVRVFDFDTKTISTIRAAELAPGMIKVRIEGVEEEVWGDSSRLQKNEYRHPPFSAEIREHLREIQSALVDVHPLTLEQWEDGFRRDRTPEREIAYWFCLAATYTRLTAPDTGLGDTQENSVSLKSS